MLIKDNFTGFLTKNGEVFILSPSCTKGKLYSTKELHSLIPNSEFEVFIKSMQASGTTPYLLTQEYVETQLECSDYIVHIPSVGKITLTCKHPEIPALSQHCMDIQAKLQRMYCRPHPQQDWTSHFG